MNTISVTNVAIAVKENGVLVDVRTPAEFRQTHAQDAQNFPLDELGNNLEVLNSLAKEQGPLYLLCQSGTRASKACALLDKEGITSIVVDGGTQAWISEGLTTESDQKGRKMISIERQVRIGAGGLVLLGSILTYAVSPWFVIIPGFVGAGLLNAGLTDWCGMGLLLAKMPWNK